MRWSEGKFIELGDRSPMTRFEVEITTTITLVDTRWIEADDEEIAQNTAWHELKSVERDDYVTDAGLAILDSFGHEVQVR